MINKQQTEDERVANLDGITNQFQLRVAIHDQAEKRRPSQKEIADAAGVSPRVVSQWMNDVDTGSATLETMAKLCAYLDCQLSDLVQLDLDRIRASVKAQKEVT